MDEEKLEALWSYYTAAAVALGSVERDGETVDAGYSLRWFFEARGNTHSPLARAFLGSGADMALVRRAIADPAGPEAAAALYGGRGSAVFMDEGLLEGSMPDESQARAIRTALESPVSFIKGPPGCGKTATILHLLSCIISQGRTAAVVSSNRSAVDNVAEKLRDFNDPALVNQQRLKNGFARLGNAARRRQFEADNGDSPVFADRAKQCTAVPTAVFLGTYPVVGSTVNSLPRCFADRPEPAYDYVIVDESSQVNTLLGLIALESARHLVLVGDDDQIPPITDGARVRAATEREAGAARELLGGDFDSCYSLTDDRSFLTVCREVFTGGDPALRAGCDRMLRFHYRCHPGIIGFCREYVYNGGGDRQLEVRTPSYDASHRTPIRVTWFQGKYAEAHPSGRSKLNRRQVEIFMDEEWPDLLARLCADPGTVLGVDPDSPLGRGRLRPLSFCVLSPYQGQLLGLRDRLNAWLDDGANRDTVRALAGEHLEELATALEEVGVEAYLDNISPDDNDLPAGADPWQTAAECIGTLPERLRPYVVGEDASPDPLEVAIPELTVHKVQGREYDIVYFLPVDDLHWEWPWSQKKRLVNVAVSRAKRELRIIASTALMDDAIQIGLTGVCVRPRTEAPIDEAGERENAFLRKLTQYVWDRGGGVPWTDGPFGFHEARTHSIFDRTALIARDRSFPGADNAPPPSAPEICLHDALRSLPLLIAERMSVYVNVPIAALSPLPGDLDRELSEYVAHRAHFDFVICRGPMAHSRVMLVIEVDGEQHRTRETARDNDEKKNRLVTGLFRAAAFTASGGDLVPIGPGLDDAAGSFTFLRLPSDGSTRDEAGTVTRLLERRLHAGTDGGAYELSVKPLNGYPEELHGDIFTALIRQQNWKTGRFPRPGDSPDDRRWIPTQSGQNAGVIQSYYPGSKTPSTGLLTPGLVTWRDDWYASLLPDGEGA